MISKDFLSNNTREYIKEKEKQVNFIGDDRYEVPNAHTLFKGQRYRSAHVIDDKTNFARRMCEINGFAIIGDGNGKIHCFNYLKHIYKSFNMDCGHIKICKSIGTILYISQER